MEALTDEQREKLQLFQSITAIESIETSLEWLQLHSFDVERSVNSFLTGESLDATTILQSAANSPTSAVDASVSNTGLRHRTVHGESASSSSSASSSAPASIPKPAIRQKKVSSPMTLMQTLLYPATLAVRIVWVLLSTIFPFSLLFSSRSALPAPPHSARDSQSTAARFLLDYEAKYGEEHPAFFQGTYSQALEVCKRELRCLLVILHSDEHDDTESFCRDTLASPSLHQFLREKRLVVWGGDIRESEGFVVSNTLLATRYPFMALIAPQGSTRMVVVERFEGPVSDTALKTALQVSLTRVDAVLRAVRDDRERHEQVRTLREQQDEAYNASLRADQEKARKAQEEATRVEKEKELEQQKLRELENKREAKRLRKIELQQTLKDEPDASDSTDIAKIGIRLPGGDRLTRRFKASIATVQDLYDYVETQDLTPIMLESDFEVINTYPRKVLSDRAQTLKDAGLYPSASVMVEEVDPDE
ncbi:hypothetical protein CcCBS67573_g01367 [Chytriomyces confervae]|uniref:UBX domain-containing protein n=1 Tax=Chytriomyces confervae TaxID=246404 RepID=A0A507FPJ7_9FUNG|nr:hypothetical protein CcCBS67573_g01367 [Chytriomyces confervae]